ncbi:hypothetical protein AAC387_Pa07g3021 [Persea americana]
MQNEKLHVVMIPWLAFGHMIPFLELAKCLAKRGNHVSFISTPQNIERIPPIPPNLSNLIDLVPLAPPPVKGLPENAQATSDIEFDQMHLLKKLHDGLEGPICTFLRNQGPTPDWIIYDMGVYWGPRVAHSFGLPCAFFGIYSASTMSFIGPPSVLLARAEKPHNMMSPEQLMVAPPWITIPTKVAFRYHEALKIVSGSYQDPTEATDDYRIGTTIQGCTLVALRTSIDYEPDWLHQLSQLYQKPILPVGFLSPSVPASLHEEENGKGNSILEEIKWLDTQKHASTVYVAFGSEFRLSQEQVTELAFGLDLSQRPFLWAYRGDPALLPIGFQGRTKGRGIVRFSWAPQPTFLAHPSIGAFLTHAGWGSTVEGLSFGKPLVMLPMMADQGLITRVMEERKVGVEVCRNERDGSFTRDAVSKALRVVMVEKEGECIRENAKEMKDIFGDKGRHDHYIDEFVQYLIKHRGEGKTPKGVD